MQIKSLLADAIGTRDAVVRASKKSIQKDQVVRSRFPYGAGAEQISARPASVAGRFGSVQAQSGVRREV